MEIVNTIESVAHAAVEAVEHPFLTIGARLKALGEHLNLFSGHPYAAPPLQDALATLHGVVADLAQEVAELRVPCPCKPAPTSATAEAGDAGQASAAAIAATGEESPGTVTLTGADLAEWRQFQAHKAAFEQFASALGG